MSQLANDEFYQHLSDDETSNHEDASDTGAAPKQQQQQVIPQTTTISNIKLPILKKEEYDIWAMEMEHYLEYIDYDVWKIIQNGNSEKRISTRKDGVIRILPPVTAVEIQAVEKEMKAKNILLMTIPKEHMRRFHGMDDAKEIWEAIRTSTNKVKSGFTGAYSTCTPSTSSTNILEKEALAGFADEGEHTEDEETNHALMAISSSSEVSLCSKTCIDSYNTLKTLCDEQMNQLGDQEAQILAYSQAVKKLEAQLGPQEPEPSVSDDRSSECSNCHSNDNARSIGTSSVHSVDFESEISRVPQEVYVSKPITTNEKGVSAPKSKEVEPSCVTHIKTPRQPIKDQETPKVNRKNWNAMMERELGEGYSFTKKKCFVCGSLSHLIKDCDYYEKKMAREAAPKKQRVFNTGNRVKIEQERLGCQTNVNFVRPRVSTVSSNVNTVRSRQPVPTRTSNNFSPKRPQGNWGSAVKTSAGYNWRPTRPNSNCNGGPTFIRTDHPLKNMVDRGIFNSRCSGHMTGNKDQLEDFEESNGGSVTFGGKGYITSLEIIRSDNGTEFKNRDMLEFCGDKRIKQEYSNARTPQQIGVAERMNRTLIKAARTMLADSLLPTTF
ncbi:ribonuclease H-like domain-containing protein [Tanacetum coccineum]